ncbi:integrase, catalytic region, zinc finger, CCHC-type containing protein, partial [Tanacetum coccineum]
MSSNSNDIQTASSDTRPLMLDRTDYDSWSQRIRLYCKGKENGIYILQLIDHGLFKLGTTRDTLGTTPEGGVLLDQKGLELMMILMTMTRNDSMLMSVQPTLCFKLTKEDKESQLYDEFEHFKMLPGENINECYNQRNFARGNGAAGNGGAHNRDGNADACQGKPIKCYNCNGLGHIARNCTQSKRPHNSDYFKDKMLLMQAQENGVVLDEEELLFMADECDAFDSDFDDKPTAQSIFMANLSSAGLANLQASPSNASILSKVHDLENAIDPSDNHQVEHEIHDEVQQKNVIESTSADMGNSNVIPYEQYLTVNDVFVVPSSASSVPNDAYVLHDNDAYVPPDPLATELNIYKEQVAIYEQRAKFELTLRERKMDEQMSILIRDRNKKEENLKKELHSVKLQLNSTIQNNKIIEETAKKAQSALYDGDELLKTHHVPIIVTSSEEDLEFLTSFLDDGRGSGSWMFLFVWSGYAAMRTLLWAGKVVIGLDFLNEGYCDNHDLSRVGNKFIERDRLIGIGLVMDLVKFFSFTIGGKEMIMFFGFGVFALIV